MNTKNTTTARAALKSPFRGFRGLLFFLLLALSVTLFAQVELNSTGSANTYVLSYPGVFSYSNGISLTFKANFANTGSATINVNGLGAKTIKKHQGDNLAASDIKSGQVVTLVYDGTNFQMTSGLGNAPGGGGGGSGWNLTGNSGTDSTANFIGTTDAQPVIFRTNNTERLKLRQDGGLEPLMADGNLALGGNALYSNTTGSQNIAIGTDALLNNTTQGSNTAIGFSSQMNSTGNGNVTLGMNTLIDNTGDNNVAIGTDALQSPGSGSNNTAVGANAGTGAPNLSNSTAIGATARVDTSNAMVLGDTTINVGFGIYKPLAKVDIDARNDGNYSGFRMRDGSQGVGKVLTSNADGFARWETPSGGGGGGSGWNLTGNSGTDSSSNFIGTTDAQPLIIKTNNTTRLKLRRDGGLEQYMPNFSKVFGSFNSLGALTTGVENSAFGDSVMVANTTGNYNSAFGFAALKANTTGSNNTAIGDWAMYRNTTGGLNTAVGTVALQRNTSGVQNSAFGVSSLGANTTGQENTAFGYNSLNNNATGSQNTAIGAWAMTAANTSSFTTAVGYGALTQNTSGSNNTAVGGNAMFVNTTGVNNTAIGRQSLGASTTGGSNTAVGYLSLGANTTGSSNTAVGRNALNVNTTGTNNTAIGASANVSTNALTNATAIGANAQVSASNSLVLGSILGVNGATTDAKVGIGTTAPSTTLHVVSTAGAGTGFRLVDGSEGANKVLTSDANGNASWQTAGGGGGGGSGWELTGNAGIDTAINFIGTTDNTDLLFKVNGVSAGRLNFDNYNTAFGAGTPDLAGLYDNTTIGSYSLSALTNGNGNTVLGSTAMYIADNVSFNIALGPYSMGEATNVNYNIAIGSNAYAYPTSGTENIAIGNSAMGDDVVTGSYNIAIGGSALGENASGSNNIAIGRQTMQYNNDGTQNIAIGDAALGNNQSGSHNTAVGHIAMNTNSTGEKNVAVGEQALYRNSDATQNTGVGYKANWGNYSGNDNAALGYFALVDNEGSNNAAVGSKSLWSNRTGSNNTAIGYQADVATSALTNATAIGANSYVGASNSMVLGSINGINDATTSTKVGIGTTTPSASLHVDGTLRYRVNGTSPIAGQVLTTDASGNATWQNAPGGGGGSGWALTGNTATDTTSNFFGTTDNLPIIIRTNNVNRLKVRVDGALEQTMSTGNFALGITNILKNSTGLYNVAFGNALTTNTTGLRNTAMGYNTLNTNQTGNDNTAIGFEALSRTTGNPAGYSNTAIGSYALSSAFNSIGNVAIGKDAARNLSTGGSNVAIGLSAMYSASVEGGSVAVGASALYAGGDGETAIGYQVLSSGSHSGDYNTGVGSSALKNSTTGQYNSALGVNSMLGNSTGSFNSAVGNNSLYTNSTGQYNVALGSYAQLTTTTGSKNTAIGGYALSTNTTGSSNTALGDSANVGAGNLENATAIGANARVDASNSMVLGSINGVNGATVNTNVGIGLTTPQARLDINATSTGAYTGFRLRDGSQQNGYVLTSDANGFATWAPAGGGGSGWALTGNTGTDSTVNFVGTTDEQSLVFKTNSSNTGYGMKLTLDGALEFATPSGSSIFIGKGTPASENFSRTTVVGDYAMQNIDLNDNSEDHTAIGFGALRNFSSGSNDYGNTAVGSQAAYNFTDGSFNTAVGASAMQDALNGSYNTALGYNSLRNNVSGQNTSAGAYSLYSNVGGHDNTAIGYYSMYALNEPNPDFAEYNTAIGSTSLSALTTGSYNTAVGADAMALTTAGSNNSAFGKSALRGANSGGNNNAFGFNALRNNDAGTENVAVGSNALLNNIQGAYNTGIGNGALLSNITGSSNVAVGQSALLNSTSDYNTGIGQNTLQSTYSGNYNTAVGYNAGSVSDGTQFTAIGAYASIGSDATENTTVLGYNAYTNNSNKVRLGNSSVTVIEGQVAYSFPSDARFKTNVSAADVKGLDFISKLRPVNYNFDTRKYEEFMTKTMPDSIRRKRLAQDFSKSTALRHTGFIAQEVEQAAIESGYNFDGGLHRPENEKDHYSVAYSQFVVPLVKAVQELNAKVAVLEKENAALKAEKESKVLGYQTTFTRTTPITVNDLQNQINELKKLIEQQNKK